jgi:5'-AMP-activated protein kinase regulatory gamma subunit
VLSQTDVIRWLGALIQAGGAGAFPRATIASLGLSPKAVVSVSAQEPTIDAFAKLLAAGLPAAAVLAAPGGAVVASLALADLTGILADKLGVLALPVGEFLALRYGTVWASASATAAPPSPGGGAAPLARRDVLMQQRALVAVRPDATIQQASLGYFP